MGYGYEINEIFPLWGWMHILFLLLPVAMVVIFHFSFRKLSSEKKRLVGIILSVINIALLIGRTIEMSIEGKWPLGEIIPLQLCHIADFVILFAFIFRKDAIKNTLFALSFCLFLPAAALAIVFPNTLNMYDTLWQFQVLTYILGHALIVATIVWALVNRLIKINIKTLLRASIVSVAMYLGMFVIANVAIALGVQGVNWFYTMSPVPATPLALFYSAGHMLYFGPFQAHPVYLVLTALFAVVVVMAMYGVYMLSMKLINKRFVTKINSEPFELEQIEIGNDEPETV